ncbi:MAG: CopG family transcriptional regulator [Elusimicrobia bacterium]|nr:CopG family transcriptional regulator [Elusimicrobiota bacterium]
MRTEKIAITMDGSLVRILDHLVKLHVFPNRSQAIQQSVKEKVERLNHTGLARECAKLDSSFERKMSEEGFVGDLSQWPQY